MNPITPSLTGGAAARRSIALLASVLLLLPHAEAASNGTATWELTGFQSDLALDGPGYFLLVDPEVHQTFVTRRGSFRLDHELHLVSEEG